MVIVVAAVLFLADVVGGPWFAATRSTQNGQQLTQLQIQQSELRTIVDTLQRVTGAPAQQRQAQMLAHLVSCLYDRIDYDTGKASTFDLSCTLPVPIPPVPSTTTTTPPPAGPVGPAGRAGATGPVGPAGPAGKTPYPFTFEFTFTVNHKTVTERCTITGPSGGSCQTS